MMMQEVRWLVTLVVTLLIITCGISGCNNVKGTGTAKEIPVGDDVLVASTVLATVPLSGAGDNAKTSNNADNVIRIEFSETGRSVAYVLETAQGIKVGFKERLGEPVQMVDALVLSRNGSRYAYSAMVNDVWGMVVDGKFGVKCSEVGEPVFSPDSRHVAYGAKTDDKWRIVMDGSRGSVNDGIKGKPVFSADSQRLAYVQAQAGEGPFRMVVSGLDLKPLQMFEASDQPIIADHKRNRLAVVQSVQKKQRMQIVSFTGGAVQLVGGSFDRITSPIFSDDDSALAYIGERSGIKYVALNDKELPLPVGEVQGQLVVRPDGQEVGVIIAADGKSVLHHVFTNGKGKEQSYDECAELAYSKDGKHYAYAARRGERWFVVVDGKEGPPYDRVVSPMFTPDNGRVVYRARGDGKRFVVVAELAGKIVRQHTSYEKVFPVTFTADGKGVAYGVQQGNKLIWKVEKL